MDDLLRKLQELQDRIDANKDYYLEANILDGELRDAIIYLRRLLNELDSSEVIEKVLKGAIKATREQAPIIFKEELENAILYSEEYSYPAFASPLLDGIKQPELYNIGLMRTGWYASAIVILEMDAVYGDISEYALAVDRARVEMHANPKRDPQKASYIWRTKIYASKPGGPYRHVISTRRALSGSPTPQDAPFWQLLNDGNKNLSLASDIGGTAYPSSGGTHFVEQAQDRIAMFFEDVMSDQRAQATRQSELIIRKIEEYEKMLDNLQKDINNYSSRFEETSPDVIEKEEDELEPQVRKVSVTKKTAKKIAERFRVHDVDDIDMNKVRVIVERMARGEDVGDVVNIGYSGERVRVSSNRLYGIAFEGE